MLLPARKQGDKKVALIECIECKKQISDKAEYCPHCGLPKSYWIDNIQKKFKKDYKKLFNGTYISMSKAKGLYKKYYKHKDIISNLKELFKEVEDSNNKYIEKRLKLDKEYFDNILKKDDPNVNLDTEQRIAILTDEDYSLLIAGAGAGKTTTMSAKVKYLVEKQNIDPKDIIVISYTNKAIDELKKRINDRLKIPVKICTFHSFGYEILRETKDNLPTVNMSAYKIILDFLEKKVFSSKKLLKNIVQFLGYYFELPENIFEFKSLNDYCMYKANLEYETIKSRLRRIYAKYN